MEQIKQTEIIIKQLQNKNVQIYKINNDNLLFNANDILDILNIVDKSDVILKEINEDDKRMITIITNNGKVLKELFLTNDGLYDISFLLGKNASRVFNSWVSKTIKEVTNDELQKQLKIMEDEIKAKDEEIKIINEEHNLNKKLLKSKLSIGTDTPNNYFVEKTSCICIMSTNTHNVYKCCKIEDKRSKTTYYDKNKILFKYQSSNVILLESVIHSLLERYRYNSYNDHFLCNFKYMKLIIQYIGKLYDSSSGTLDFDRLLHDELLNKIKLTLLSSSDDESYYGTETDNEIESSDDKSEYRVEKGIEDDKSEYDIDTDNESNKHTKSKGVIILNRNTEEYINIKHFVDLCIDYNIENYKTSDNLSISQIRSAFRTKSLNNYNYRIINTKIKRTEFILILEHILGRKTDKNIFNNCKWKLHFKNSSDLVHNNDKKFIIVEIIRNFLIKNLHFSETRKLTYDKTKELFKTCSRIHKEITEINYKQFIEIFEDLLQVRAYGGGFYFNLI